MKSIGRRRKSDDSSSELLLVIVYKSGMASNSSSASCRDRLKMSELIKLFWCTRRVLDLMCGRWFFTDWSLLYWSYDNHSPFVLLSLTDLTRCAKYCVVLVDRDKGTTTSLLSCSSREIETGKKRKKEGWILIFRFPVSLLSSIRERCVMFSYRIHVTLRIKSHNCLF